jgi:NTP pyrophosphatase (non-canonical NTP hydrolase)
MEESEIYKTAWAKFGKNAQMNLVNEECGELISAVSRYFRDRHTQTEAGLLSPIDHLTEELIDVEIMIAQLKQNMIDPASYARFKKYKLMRLENRLKD